MRWRHRGHIRLRMCRPCGKWRFATEGSARAWLAEISGPGHPDSTVQGVYECPHGWFHLTSQPERRPA